MPASVESPAGTTPSVLLIEEYDALAAAITSALRKFAPQHRTHVVQSLSDAEVAAAETQPQLFIIDLDPPHPKAIEFLNRIRTAHPEARVLAIASGTSAEFSSKRYGPNAVHFVEKPFELADFGAAVQALLGPWTEAHSGDSRGTLRDLNLRDLVPLECVNGATAVLKIEAAGKQTGEIHFLAGRICHASASGLSGIDAFYEMMRWESARGSETKSAANGPCTIQGPWLHIFLEALRRARPSDEELNIPSPEVSSLTAPKPAKPQPKSGKKIVVIDDTEMLLIFVEDILSSADPSLQIVTALTGGEGLRRSEVMIPDLVLLDYSMPDLRGDQVCERLLQNKATARIPVVMMSGHILEMMATAKRYPNVVATIAKPFMSEALVRMVHATLGKGPLPTAPQKATAIQEVIDHPINVASLASKSVRHGNGKRPAKKSASATSSTRKVVEKAIASASPPVIPAPPPQEKRAELAVARAPESPTPANLIKVTEQLATAATPAPTSGPPTRDIRPAEPALLERPPLTSPRLAKLPGSNGGRVVLRLGMEVISVQITPRFQIGAIRAKPSATLSLTQLSMPQLAEDRGATGFALGSVELDSDGRIRTMRVRPTRRPAESIQTRSGFDINDVKLVNEAACIQLSAGSFTPMTMQLLALFKVTAVELSDGFEVAQLVLQPEGSRVRITLDPQTGGGGMEFEAVGVRLDASGRIAEFVLNSTAPRSVAA